MYIHTSQIRNEYQYLLSIISRAAHVFHYSKALIAD